MDIKIKKVTKSSSQSKIMEMPSISITKQLKKSSRPNISISDMEVAPGPDQNTILETQEGIHNEFHFLKSIIIDNELY